MSDPTDYATPADSDMAKSAAEHIRDLKEYVLDEVSDLQTETAAAIAALEASVAVDIAAIESSIAGAAVNRAGTMVTTVFTIPATISEVSPWTEIPINTRGTQIATLSFTPKYADSNLEIIATIPIAAATGATSAWALLFQDSIVGCLASTSAGFTTAGNYTTNLTLKYFCTSGSVTPRTYKLRLVATIAPVYVNTIVDVTPAAIFGGTSQITLSIVEYHV